MRLILTNLKHFFSTLLLLTLLALAVASYFGVDVDYGDDLRAFKVGEEGPHVFYQGDQLLVQHIRGDAKSGFVVEQHLIPAGHPIKTAVYFPLEDQTFALEVSSQFRTPAVIYQDAEPMLVLSDFESSFKTFRDFLITHQVIDSKLNWTFGRGHLVLIFRFFSQLFLMQGHNNPVKPIG